MTSSDRLQQAYNDHDRRLDKAEELISDVRRATIGIERTMAESLAVINVTLKSMEKRWGWVEKLVFAAAIGIFGTFGAEIWRLITPR